jgi:superfamily II DNA or RNA helicase
MHKGIYEKTISKSVKSQLQNLSDDLEYHSDKIDNAELAQKLSRCVNNVLTKSLERIKKSGEQTKTNRQIALVNKIFETMAEYTDDDDFLYEQIEETELPEILTSIQNKQVAQKLAIRPITSIAESTLFTGSSKEPSLGSEIQKEIVSANEICLLISFIRWTGLVLIYDELQEFTQAGGKLRVITTSYMGATDYKAVEKIAQLTNTEIKVSYDTKRTRLHAKAYIFKRNTGYSTIYIGSSNISRSAMEKGLEWNTKITQTDFPTIYQQSIARFETYWNQDEFVEFKYNNESHTIKLKNALSSESNTNIGALSVNFDIKPYTYQLEILEALEAERQLYKNYRNLIVAATGTGKTIISAFDYKRYCDEHPKQANKLLFIAHRQEILRQSLTTFQVILHNPNFGDLWFNGETPTQSNHLFVSIQTLNSKNNWELFSSDHYDFIIIDEFHHSGAKSYKKILEKFSPKILLGLTATPERTDGAEKEIIDTYFDGHFSAEIRLPEAIERKLLTPFQYFGITDTVDYTKIRWRNGGYDITELENLLTDNNIRCNNILKNINKYVTSISEIRALAFCATQKHADYMADFFCNHNIAAESLHSGQSDHNVRRGNVVERLQKREINILCVVDIFNEGVDIPFLDTVLFLRPTESLTVFLQQLGRGLRLYDNKEVLTVLDFVGQAHMNFSFESRFHAMLGTTGTPIETHVQNDFANMPVGCSIKLERKAKEYILNNIQQYFKNGGGRFVNRIKSFTNDSGLELTMSNFINFYNLKLSNIYRYKTWTELCEKAGLLQWNDPDKEILKISLRRIVHINSWKYLQFLLTNWNELPNINYDTRTEKEQQFLRMFYYCIWKKPLSDYNFSSITDAFKQFFDNPFLTAEAKEILEYNHKHIKFLEKEIDLPYELALDVHSCYIKDEIMAAFGHHNLKEMPAHREGVKYFKDINTDAFFITLNKAEKEYSPTTMYRDYALSEILFHWQSQSTTPENSPTGQRYTKPQAGHNVLLFVREQRTQDGLTSPYHFLGKCEYVEHQGTKPINITWKLHEPMPAYLVAQNRRLA